MEEISLEQKREEALRVRKEAFDHFVIGVRSYLSSDDAHQQNDWVDWVWLFHAVFGHPTSFHPVHVSPETMELRYRLIQEEFFEFEREVECYQTARRDNDKELADDHYIEIADALGDLIVVILGTCISMGLPIRRVMKEIMLSNFSKLDNHGRPVYRADGKIMKGPNYFKPQLREVISCISEN